MIMELPKKFKLPFAEVTKDGQLIMDQVIRYEDLIYELAYALKKKRCVYCDTRLKNKLIRTIDHRYPRATGGVSIVDNLFPCCSKCNSDKGDLTHKEYLIYREMNDWQVRAKFLKQSV